MRKTNWNRLSLIFGIATLVSLVIFIWEIMSGELGLVTDLCFYVMVGCALFWISCAVLFYFSARKNEDFSDKDDYRMEGSAGYNNSINKVSYNEPAKNIDSKLTNFMPFLARIKLRAIIYARNLFGNLINGKKPPLKSNSITDQSVDYSESPKYNSISKERKFGSLGTGVNVKNFYFALQDGEYRSNEFILYIVSVLIMLIFGLLLIMIVNANIGRTPGILLVLFAICSILMKMMHILVVGTVSSKFARYRLLPLSKAEMVGLFLAALGFIIVFINPIFLIFTYIGLSLLCIKPMRLKISSLFFDQLLMLINLVSIAAVAILNFIK